MLAFALAFFLFSCDGLSDADIVEELQNARTTQITFYDQNPIQNPNANSVGVRYEFEYTFNINSDYPKDLKDGGIPEEWKYIDFENPSAPPPVNVSVVDGRIETIYVTQRELCFYAESWSQPSAPEQPTEVQEPPAHIHAWDEGVVTLEPTADDDGEKTYTCTGCGQTKTEAVPALNHEHTIESGWTYDDTYHWHEASCGKPAHIVDKDEHAWSITVTTAATCTTDGVAEYTCVTCGATKTETVAATGHTFATEWTSNSTHHWHAATCGHTAEKKDEAAHVWGSSDTCTECGAVKATSEEVAIADLIAYLSDPSLKDTTPKITVKANSSADITSINTALTNSSVTNNVSGVDLVLTTDSLTSLSTNAFNSCSKLTSVTIPDSVISIGGSAFEGCSGLTSVTIGNSVETIGNYAFSGCASLTSVTIPDSVNTIESYAFYGCSELTSVTIPDGVTSISKGAFSGCSALTSVTIPDGVTIINASAFQYCSGLESVTIPDSVNTIESYAFRNCSGLTSVTIPDGVTIINASAFQYCSGLTSVTIPDGVTSIGDSAFSYCSGLTSVTIGNSVETIGKSAFFGCSGLTSVTIPDGITSIGESAFFGCSGLTSVTISDGVTKIENYAFKICSELESITVRATTPPTLRTGVFDSNKSGRKIYVPAGSVDDYKAADGWSSYADDIEAIP